MGILKQVLTDGRQTVEEASPGVDYEGPMSPADADTDGYLTQEDWSTFNAKAPTEDAVFTGTFSVLDLPVYANNAAAIAGGLAAGRCYRTGGDPDLVCVVH